MDILELMEKAGVKFDDNVMLWAAFGGRLDVVRWLEERGVEPDNVTAWYAGAQGMSSLPLVEYLTQHYPDVCGFDSEMISGAALSGDIDFVKLLASKGYKYETASWACAFAARMGHLEMLMHFRRQGAKWGLSCWQYAGARNNNLAVLGIFWPRATNPTSMPGTWQPSLV